MIATIMDELSEERLLSYLALLERICHNLPLKINKQLTVLRELELTQSEYRILIQKCSKSINDETASIIPCLLEEYYKCSFKRIQPLNAVLETLKKIYSEVVDKIDFSIDTTKLTQIGFSQKEITEQRDQHSVESVGSLLTRRGRRGKAKSNQFDNIEDYTFYKDDNFSLDLFSDDEESSHVKQDDENSLENGQIPFQENNGSKRKRGPYNSTIHLEATSNEPTTSSSLIVKSGNKKKRGKYNTPINANLLEDNMNLTNDREPTYCFCNQVSFGGMVACDSEDCPYQWFHYSCVGLNVAPEGVWFCPECQDKRKNNNSSIK